MHKHYFHSHLGSLWLGQSVLLAKVWGWMKGLRLMILTLPEWSVKPYGYRAPEQPWRKGFKFLYQLSLSRSGSQSQIQAFFSSTSFQWAYTFAHFISTCSSHSESYDPVAIILQSFVDHNSRPTNNSWRDMTWQADRLRLLLSECNGFQFQDMVSLHNSEDGFCRAIYSFK